MANSIESIIFMCNFLYCAVNLLMVLKLAVGWLAFKAKLGTKKKKNLFHQ